MFQRERALHISSNAKTWSSSVIGDEGCIGPNGKLLWLWQIKKIMQHMHGIISYMFDSWRIQLFISFYLKSSMAKVILMFPCMYC